MFGGVLDLQTIAILVQAIVFDILESDNKSVPNELTNEELKMNKYRVMVRGEDGMLFCTANNVEQEELQMEIDEAEDDYPCASVFVEEEAPPVYDDYYSDIY